MTLSKSDPGGDPPPPPPPPFAEQLVFQAIVDGLPPPKHYPQISKFMKNLNAIPEVSLSIIGPRLKAIALTSRRLVGKFMGLWPSPKDMNLWVQNNWKVLIKGRLYVTFCGRGFYIFPFELQEYIDLISRNGPYFMGAKGMYLNKWSPDFDPEAYIPSSFPLWVLLPHLPLHCWDDDFAHRIGNSLGRYVDRMEPKDNMYACVRISVEVDLERGLL
jgi:hypothetical protein